MSIDNENHVKMIERYKRIYGDGGQHIAIIISLGSDVARLVSRIVG